MKEVPTSEPAPRSAQQFSAGLIGSGAHQFVSLNEQTNRS